ncbi:Putative aminoglycoside phosphotransferase, protein kinase-like domain superfamily [Septoria linicola]|uniref:Aminoglycoside phosphotransferase, protein kinase-like domain superfamily n=1 Tax=Septoria linicola TaxID=215465 RepID=A0A9Q9EJS0_9PEZI|nr:Putative aminoglycoside phosphotransferase, protein kinase-like domain superfamily [Septoria linicola]
MNNSSPRQPDPSSAHDLFEYTSGRWVYNERKRFGERERVFNVAELQRMAAEAVGRKAEDVVSMSKLGEGAANRAFVICFRDKFKLVARIPYPVTEPCQQVVASEAATMAFLRSKDIPVPEIYGYSASAKNPAQTEYIFMEFSPGRNLGSLWPDMNEHDRLRFMKSLVRLESRLFNLDLPASGSLYFVRDLDAASEGLPVTSTEHSTSASFYIGPSTSLSLWYGKRKQLDIDRGPYTETEAVLKAGAEKEISYLEHFGRPLFPFDRMRRETFNLEKQLPSIHLDSLRKYLRISSDLIPKGCRELTQPIVRHPDLRPSNIFVSDDYEITSMIDWQNATALPMFLQSGIPDDLDNSLDPVSSSQETPRLPDHLSTLGEEISSEELAVFEKRQLHYFYMKETSNINPKHYEALTYPFSAGRRKVYDLASSPWQGDNVPLRSSLIFTKQHWHQIVANPDLPCPISFSADEEQESLRLDDLEREAAEQLKGSMEMLGLGPEGWVANDNYEGAKEAITRMKEICLEQAETEIERRAVRDHWVYDDMDEDEYQ